MSTLEKATIKWNGNPPEFVKKLAIYCDEGNSQTDAGRKIKRSAALINQVLYNNYKGDMEAVEDRVLSALGSNKVVCPLLEEISKNQCLANQRKPFSASNHMSIKIFKACRNCSHNMEREVK